MKRILILLMLIGFLTGCVYLRSGEENVTSALRDGEGIILVDGPSLDEGYKSWNEFCEE